MKGIDVSVHNGAIDWNKVKADGVEFAILRAGYGRVASQKDARFEENYAGAKAAGIPVGAYWYSYAVTVEEARLEAEVCLSRGVSLYYQGKAVRVSDLVRSGGAEDLQHR